MWYSLTTVKNTDGSFKFTTCSPNGEQGYYGGYFYVLTPSGTQLGKVDIPKGECRTDTIAASDFTESGKHIAKVSDYNGFVWEEQDIYPTASYFGYIAPANLNDPNPACYQIGETVPVGKSCCLGANAILQANGTYVCQKDPASPYTGMRGTGTAQPGTTSGTGGIAPKSDSGMTALLLGVGILVAALIFKKR